jgi:hypothetical protein
MAILRIGGRVPDDPANPGPGFLYNSPPLLRVRPKSNPTVIIPQESYGIKNNTRPSPLRGRGVGGEGQTAFDNPPATMQTSVTEPEDQGSWATAGDIQ